MPFSATLLLAKVPTAVYNVQQVCVAHFYDKFLSEVLFQEKLAVYESFFQQPSKKQLSNLIFTLPLPVQACSCSQAYSQQFFCSMEIFLPDCKAVFCHSL